jgi:hypothetical protein
LAAIFENNPRRPNVTGDLATGAYDNLFRTAKFSFYLAINADYASIDVRSHTSIFTNYE